MGIRYLGRLIDDNKWANTVYLSKYQGKRVAIDANLFLYRLYYQYGNIVDGLFFLINKLSKHRITAIFIFDGRPPIEKGDIIAHRRRRREVYKERYDDMISHRDELEASLGNDEYTRRLRLLERKMFVVSREVVDEATAFIEMMGYVWARYDCEAEHLCAYLSRENLVDAVITDDMDVLACGARVVLRGFGTRYDTVEEIRLVDCLRGLGISLERFQDMCILLGTEYNAYREPIVTPDNLRDIVEYVRNGTISDVITHIREYNSENGDISGRIRDIFALKYIELTYEQRRNLWNPGRSYNISEILEYMRSRSTLSEETLMTRLRRKIESA